MAFNNDILAGTKLVREAIESPNYVPGTAGWRIAKDGSAEFSDVDVRGTLESTNYVPGTSGWHLDNDGTAEMRDLIMQGTWRVENILSTPGYIEGGIVGNIPYLKFNGLVGLGQVSALMQMGDASGVGRWRLGIEPQSSEATLVFVQGEGIAFQKSPGGQAVMFDNQTGYLRAGSWAPWVENQWINLSGVFAGLWGAAANPPPQYRINALGKVQFRGRIVSTGASAAASQVFTMPLAFRNDNTISNQRFVCANSGSGADNVLDFASATGIVTLGRATSGATGLSLDQIEYQLPFT